MAEHNDFQWFATEDITLELTMTPEEDITGWTTELRVRAGLRTAVVLLTISGDILSAPEGVFTVNITSAQNTVVLTPGAYAYSFSRTDVGSVSLLSEGIIVVKPAA